MKNLEKAIIMALHPECDTWDGAVLKETEEARKNVFSIYGMDDLVEWLPEIRCEKCFSDNIDSDDYKKWCSDCGEEIELYRFKSSIIKNIISLAMPCISLPRVMQAFDNISGVDDTSLFYIREIGDGCAWLWYGDEFIGKWKLTENAKDLNLEDQSEETKLKLLDLFTKTN